MEVTAFLMLWFSFNGESPRNWGLFCIFAIGGTFSTFEVRRRVYLWSAERQRMNLTTVSNNHHQNGDPYGGLPQKQD